MVAGIVIIAAVLAARHFMKGKCGCSGNNTRKNKRDSCADCCGCGLSKKK